MFYWDMFHSWKLSIRMQMKPTHSNHYFHRKCFVNWHRKGGGWPAPSPHLLSKTENVHSKTAKKFAFWLKLTWTCFIAVNSACKWNRLCEVRLVEAGWALWTFAIWLFWNLLLLFWTIALDLLGKICQLNLSLQKFMSCSNSISSILSQISIFKEEKIFIFIDK